MITPGISVWVVDDDESVRWVLEQALKQAHMIPRCFDSALKFFKALDDARPDVLVTDIRMPEMSGLELLERLGAREPDLPVIVFSSFAEAETGERLLGEGAQDHLVKGQMSGDVLIRSMRHGIEHGRLVRELREARELASHASRERSELVAELAQEARTPLHTVLGMADLLLETELTREQEGYVRSALRASGIRLRSLRCAFTAATRFASRTGPPFGSAIASIASTREAPSGVSIKLIVLWS